MIAGMNVIFRGNAKRKAEREREQEEAAPAEEVFSSQATRCAKRELQIERRRREREGEREGAQRLQQLRGSERERTAEVRDGREKRREKSDGKPECSVFFSKRPPAMSPVCTLMNRIKLQKEKKRKKKISSAWLLFEIICK